jgi:NADPH:quinone reductase-like Zn-dependent oxidoreductase
VPEPSPRVGELLVRVQAAGLNPIDFKTRAGALRIIHNYPLPIVMGNELSGVIEAVRA